MNCKAVNKILSDTSYVRVGGTSAEKQCAEYLKSACKQLGFNASIEPFPVTMYDIKCARLTIDGKEITCSGYGGCGSHGLAMEEDLNVVHLYKTIRA